MKQKLLIASAMMITFAAGAAVGANQPKFSRAELLVMNLNRGPTCSGFFLLQSLRQTRETVRSLDRAIRQVEQVDKEYAKSKGRPDDTFFPSTLTSMKAAKATAEKLEQQLDQAKDELKANIQESLVAP